MKNQHILAVASVIIASAAAAQAQLTITDWDFDTLGVVAAPDNTVSATTGTGTATQLGMSNSYTYANGEGPGSVANSDIEALAGASTGAASDGWRIRGNSNSKNSGTGKANGWNSAAPIGTQGAEFSASTAGYNTITVSMDVNDSAQGDRNLAIEYTLDDTAATPTWLNATITSAGTLGTIANNTTSANTISGNYVQLSASGTGWNNDITATISGAQDDPNFAIEVVNASTGADDVNAADTAVNNSSGNWVFDNVDISGTMDVPEPSSIALIGIGVAGLAAYRKSRKA